jgi:hypothetical protein
VVQLKPRSYVEWRRIGSTTGLRPGLWSIGTPGQVVPTL